MARLADCLLPLLFEFEDNANELDVNDESEDKEAHEQQALAKVETLIHQFTDKFDTVYYAMYSKKLGMNEMSLNNKILIDDLLTIMQENALDYTQTFLNLTKSLSDTSIADELSLVLGQWYQTWLSVIENIDINKVKALMRKNNPVVIPRNHHVESILSYCEAAIESNSSGMSAYKVINNILDEFMTVLLSPYDELEVTKKYQDTPKDGDKYYQTFCGT